MNQPPRISVVIPAYNAVRTIKNTLESTFRQTLVAHEVIVIDDGSKDGTVQFIQSGFPQVRVISQANAGPAAARNHGVRVSTGDWIAFLDADDSWLPSKLERQCREITQDVGLIHTHTVGDKGKNDCDLNFDILWHHNYIGTSTVLLDKALFQQINGFSEDRTLTGAEDYHLWLRMAATGRRIVSVREELTCYTPAEGNLSGQITRVVEAELLNASLIGREFNLAPEQVREKHLAILEEYGRALFWVRDLPAARRYFLARLRKQLDLKTLGFWLATFVPARLLNVARKTTQNKNEALLQAATSGMIQ